MGFTPDRLSLLRKKKGHYSASPKALGGANLSFAALSFCLCYMPSLVKFASSCCFNSYQFSMPCFRWHWQAIFLQSRNVRLNGIPDVGEGFLASLPLRHTAWQTGHFGDVKVVVRVK